MTDYSIIPRRTPAK